MKNILTLAALLAGIAANAQTFKLDNPYFKEAYPLKADGKIISVTVGHASPYIYDFNKDGLDDLLVGEFGEVDYDGIDRVDGHENVQGRCRIYLNYGTNAKPVYKDFTYLSAQGEPMKVPVDCCISFTPRFADINNDGIDDVFSGSITGEMFMWKGLGNNQFAKDVKITDKTGKVIVVGESMTVFPVDWDLDGDLDLLSSSRFEGLNFIENSGDKNHYQFEQPVNLNIKPHMGKWAPSYLYPYDWDGDGVDDLVGGTEFGHLVWVKNIGTNKERVFGEPQTLKDNTGNCNARAELIPTGYRTKCWMYDYDKDGKDDMIVGDVWNYEKYIRELTPKERKEYDALKAKCTKMNEAYIKEFEDHINQLYSDPTVMPKPEYQEARAKIHEIAEKLSEIMSRSTEMGTNGNVWVFVRK